MRLEKILSGIEYNAKNFRDLEIRGISSDSNQVHNNFLFIALRGETKDGHKFIYQAIERGASVIVSEENQYDEILFADNVVSIGVKDTKKVLHKISSNYCNEPERYLDIIGVTGTNGKTTITFLLEKIFSIANKPAGIIGTICYKVGNREIPSFNTTPNCLSIHKYMREMVDNLQDTLFMEVSSHGLKQGRLNGFHFDAAIFTNLGKDHLDYHRDMESYYNAKKILFSEHLKDEGIAVINIDDLYGARLYKEISKNKISYGFSPDADVRLIGHSIESRGMHLKINVAGLESVLYSPLFGRHNAYNITAAYALALKYGIEKEKIAYALENFEGVKGRMERVFGSSQIKVFVDYAHTPQALEQVLLTLKEIKKNKLWVVFGCGGDRCKEKRPDMGVIAFALADRVVITSDNPRNENPGEIIDDILQGVKFSENCLIIPDRREAIEKTIANAENGDIVLIAGKGHERYQILGNLIIPMDDKEIASKTLAKRTIREMANVV